MIDFTSEAQALAHFEYSENPDMNGRERWLRSFAARLLRDAANNWTSGGIDNAGVGVWLEARASEIEREGK